MKLLGRKPSRLLSALLNLPEHMVAGFRCVRLFKNPVGVLWGYIRRRNPGKGSVELRDGLKIKLSEDDSDIVTVFLIFCRYDYGQIRSGSNVVDIGANIGVFSLFAARSGAGTVNAYEPSEASYALLCENIRRNDMEHLVFPHHFAVVGKPSPPVLFPRRSSVFNAITRESNDLLRDDQVMVQTITFAEIIANLARPNIVKLDCEGGEYDIILDSEESIFDDIDEIRLEYHQGPYGQLLNRFEELGFIRRQFMDEGEGGGYLWLTRSSGQSGL